MSLSPLLQHFVPHFGEMGSRWGINRKVGQIHALIFVSPRPINADEIAEASLFSRSHVSRGLKGLQAWRLVHLRHLAGDRRESFVAPHDVWEIFRSLAEERRRHEIEPTLSMLREAWLASPGHDDNRHAQQRMCALHDFIEPASTWFDDVQRLDAKTLARLMEMGAKVQEALEFTGQVKSAA